MGKYSIRKSLVLLCGSACLCAAVLLLALVLSPVKVYASDHGNWGGCTWTITTEADGSKTMTLEGNTPWAQAGYTTWKPWNDSSNKEDFKGLTKMVIGTKQNPVTINKGSDEKSNSLSFLFSGLDTVTDIDMTWADTTGCDRMSFMFNNCKALTNLTLGEHFNTSSVKSMASMFYDCNALKQLDLSMFDTSNVSDMSLMFYGCKAIEKLDLTKFKTDKLTAICDTTGGGLFCGCESLTTLLLPESFNTSAIKVFSYMFSGCKKLTELDVSKFNTTSAEDMRGMFSGCSALESIIGVSSFDTSGVTHMGDMFSGCSALESIDVSSFDTSGVTRMASMFSDCSSLKSVDLSNFDVSNIDSMYVMFKGCQELTEVTMPESKQGAKKQIKNLNELFAGCKSLTEVDMSGLDTKKVECASKMFENCSSLATLSCDLSFFQNIKTVQDETYTYDTFIYAFTGCNNLKELPASLKLSEEICTLAVTGGGVYDSCPMFDFGDNVPSSPVVTRYKGSDPNVIKYPWKGDSRVLDITSLEEGEAAIKIQKGGQDAGASVSVGDALTCVFTSDTIQGTVAGQGVDAIAFLWTRETKDGTVTEVGNEPIYTVGDEDSGSTISVKLTGINNFSGELTASAAVTGKEAGDEPSGDEPSGDKPAGNEPSGNKPAGNPGNDTLNNTGEYNAEGSDIIEEKAKSPQTGDGLNPWLFIMIVAGVVIVRAGVRKHS